MRGRRHSVVEDERVEQKDTPQADQPGRLAERSDNAPVHFPVVFISSGSTGTGQMTADEYAEAIGDRVRVAILHVLSGSEGTDLNLRLADPDSMAGVISDLVIDRANDPAYNEIADLVAPFWSAEHARHALGSPSRSALAERRRAGTILGLKTTDGDIFYPVSQFETHEGKVRVRPALREFFRALRDHDPWTVAVLLHTPAPELDNRSPLDWVRQRGATDQLVEYARIVNTEFSR